MKNILVKVIVGTLFHFRENPKTAGFWKFGAWAFLTFNFVINLSTILIIFDNILIRSKLGRLHVVVFENSLLNKVFVFAAIYGIVGIVVYFFVFRNRKYDFYLNKYPNYRSSNYSKWYFIGSYAVLFIVFIIAIWPAIVW